MDVDRQAFQPAVVYINGEYWGILNIREKINSNFLAENHFVNPDNVNLLEFNGNVIEGSNSGYMDLISYLENNTLENAQKYSQVSRKIDLEQLYSVSAYPDLYKQQRLARATISNTGIQMIPEVFGDG